VPQPETMQVPEELLGSRPCYALRVRGDSMIAAFRRKQRPLVRRRKAVGAQGREAQPIMEKYLLSVCR